MDLRQGGVLLLPPDTEAIRGALILLGRNATLRFKNVAIYNSQNLFAVTALSTDSMVLTREEDSVLMFAHSPEHDSEYPVGKFPIWDAISPKGKFLYAYLVMRRVWVLF